MTAAAMFSHCVFQTKKDVEMPEKSLRLSIIVGGIVLVGLMGFVTLLASNRYMESAIQYTLVTGFITTFTGIMIGHIIQVGKLFGLDDNVTRTRQEIKNVEHGVKMVEGKADTAARKLTESPLPATVDDLMKMIHLVLDERERRNVGKDI